MSLGTNLGCTASTVLSAASIFQNVNYRLQGGLSDVLLRGYCTVSKVIRGVFGDIGG